MYNNYIFDLYGTLIDINTDEWNDDLWKKIAIFYAYKGAHYTYDELNEEYDRLILFICGGAFPDLDEIIKKRLMKQTSIGFHADLKDKFDKDENILSRVTVDDLREYGMIPEFLGRLPMVFTLEGLSKDMLVRILKEPKNAILKQYQKLLELDEVELIFDESALEAIAEKALEKKTGARALRAIIEKFMLDIMFEIPKDDTIGRVIINRDYILNYGTPVIELRGQ